MEELIKQTGTGPKLTGYEKVAILLGELDNEAYYKVMHELSLSRKQFHKIRKAMKKLGKYNPHDYRQTVKETSVLSELVSFLKGRNHYQSSSLRSASLKLNLNQNNNTDNQMKDMVKNNPEDIANILKTWLKE